MAAACTDPQFNWLFNMRGQSPCEMAAQLAVPCGTSTLGTPWVLAPETKYPPISQKDANPCLCNSVYYSLMVGCSACQSRDYLTYPQYTAACSKTYYKQYPARIPDGTSIPDYAYLDLYQGTQFYWTNAMNDPNHSESTGGSPLPSSTSKPPNPPASSNPQNPQTTQNAPTQGQGTTVGNPNTIVTSPQPSNGAASDSVNTKVSTIATNGVTTIVTYGGNGQPTTSGQTGSALPTSGSGNSQSENATASSDSSKAGPIAGGVVGGIATICIFLAFIWWLRQRERRLRQDQAHLVPTPLMAQHGNDDLVEPPPYMPSDAATIGSSQGPTALTKSAHRALEPQRFGGANPGSSGHRPIPSDGGSSAALTGYASTGPHSGSESV